MHMISRMKRIPVIDWVIIVLLLVMLVVFANSYNRYHATKVVTTPTVSRYGFVGDGSIDNPYLLSDALDIRYLSELVNAGNTFYGRYFQFTNDIDMTGVTITPIGQIGGGKYFYGILDGNGYVLKNITVSTSGDGGGLFGILGGTVMNLGIEDGYIGNADYSGSVGAIAGQSASDNARIINCYNTATVAGYRAGGIADDFSGLIYNCWSDCELIGVEVGGTTSRISAPGTQVFCYSTTTLVNDGSGTWYNCNQLSPDELYTKSMARMLSLDCLVWAETKTPLNQFNRWIYEDGILTLSNEKMSVLNLADYFWCIVYSYRQYTRLMIMTTLIFISIIITIVVYRRRNNL